MSSLEAIVGGRIDDLCGGIEVSGSTWEEESRWKSRVWYRSLKKTPPYDSIHVGWRLRNEILGCVNHEVWRLWPKFKSLPSFFRLLSSKMKNMNVLEITTSIISDCNILSSQIVSTNSVRARNLCLLESLSTTYKLCS